MIPGRSLNERLQRLEEYLRLLEALQREPRSELLADPVRRGALERYLQLAIEALLDIGNHLLAEHALARPETYADIFRLLAEAGLIPDDLRVETEGMAGFRNLLVHDYMRLEPEKLGQILDQRLGTMRRMANLFAEAL